MKVSCHLYLPVFLHTNLDYIIILYRTPYGVPTMCNVDMVYITIINFVGVLIMHMIMINIIFEKF